MQQEDRKGGRFQDGTESVIGALIEVHRALGPGLLESAYEVCLCAALALREMCFERQLLELKSVEPPRLANLPVGLLVNFK